MANEVIDLPQIEEETIEAQEYAPGELAPVIVTSQKVWKPDDLPRDIVQVITTLSQICSTTDEAARRFSVLQTWEMRHMDRGYQYLEPDQRGGWKIAGVDSSARHRNQLAAADDAGLYATNVLSAQGDIATGALNRGKIKVSFSPKRSKNPADVAAADTANQYKYLWEKYNPRLQSDIANLGWTDCRVVTWTRSVADKSRFGVNEDGTPRIVEMSTAHGVLESKLPMMVDSLKDCGYVQIFEEMDYAVARAAYPWMGDKIKPSWGTYGELEFERIARINTRIGIVGKYITGTSGIRETTMGYLWFRPGLYFDDQVQAKQREFLLTNFPDGLFVVMAGPELCCCWNESVDDHVELGLFTRGFGQNRRSLGSSDLPIQKRINIWADLWDKFVRTAIPITLLEDKAFNAEAVAQLEASPARFLPVALDEGQSMQDIVGQTPAPVPIQGMAEMFQWYIGPLIQSIDGATPALFGGAEGQDNTVGATQIRLNQSLERFGPPWQMMNAVIARCAYQAAKSCGENGNAELNDTVEGVGDVSVNPANLRGEFECAAETSGAIPESGAQREAKIMQVLDMAQVNPQVASVVGTPSNAREIIKGLHLDDVITVDESDSEDKQLEEIEELLESEPLLNPEWQQLSEQVELLNVTHEAAKTAATEGLAAGNIPTPDVIEQGQQMEQQLQQLQQQFEQTPKYLPSVPVAQDESEDHTTEAATLFSWMQEPEGRALRKQASRESEGGPNWKKWTNCYLHWQGHKQMAAKLAAQNAPQIPPRMTISIPVDKMHGEAQTQLLQKAGIQVSGPYGQPHEVEQEVRAYTPVSEIVQKTKRRL
jgi:hypothetical protein